MDPLPTQLIDNRTPVDRAVLVGAPGRDVGPVLAEEQVREILKVYPDTLEAQRILASAYRLQGKPQRGLDVLTPLLATHTWLSSGVTATPRFCWTGGPNRR